MDWTMREDLHPRLPMLKDGISEFTFANLFLFRNKYGYRLAALPDNHLVISGVDDAGRKFFMMPCGPSNMENMEELFENHDYLKNLSESAAAEYRIELERNGYQVVEDRDNFDYLYLRKDLVHLSGKKLHKKRNLVNAFINNYTYEEKRINAENRKDTIEVLERWADGREDLGDYEAALEAIEKMEKFNLSGCLTYVDGRPAAYSLGEPLARGRCFAVHFEKAIAEYKGIYQFINRSFASMLARHYVHINREQDLGDPGLRQAKMSYRPSGFVKKYKVFPPLK
jgi:hypothetical protein